MKTVKMSKITSSFRKFSTTIQKCEITEMVNKTRYYKKLGTAQSTDKPKNWDEALPFGKIPGPKPLPLIGNIWRFLLPNGDFYKLDLQDIHRKLHQQYGDVVMLKGIPGSNPFVHIFNPNDIEMLHRNEGVWPRRHGLPSFAYYRTVVRKDIFQGAEGTLSMQGEDWFNFRSLVNPILMQPRTAQQYVASMDEIATDFIANMKYFSGLNNGEMPENFVNEINKWALESIGVITMNKRLGCLARDLDEDSEAMQLINAVLEMFELMYHLDVRPSFWRVISTPTWRKYVNKLDFITETILKHITEATREIEQDLTEKPEHEKSVLQRLLQKDKKVALSMALDMMIAGIDTTGRSTAAALYFLAKNPEKQQKLREEGLQNLPTKTTPISKETILKSPYLKAVVKETLRICPIAVGSLRSTPKDMVLGGYQIPQGTEIITSNLILCLMEKNYPKPKEFLPERWLKSTSGEMSYKNTHPFVYLPFGFGPRSCLGQRLANLEMQVALLKVIRNFELSWPHEEMKFSSKVLHGIAQPLRIHVKPFKE